MNDINPATYELTITPERQASIDKIQSNRKALGLEPLDIHALAHKAFDKALTGKLNKYRHPDELPSAISAKHLVTPEVGDCWSRFGGYGEIWIIKIIAEDDMVAFFNAINHRLPGYYRLSRATLASIVHNDCGQQPRITDLAPCHWEHSRIPMDKESQCYKGIVKDNAVNDYADAEQLG